VFLSFLRNEGNEVGLRALLDIGLAEVTRIGQKVFRLAKGFRQMTNSR